MENLKNLNPSKLYKFEDHKCVKCSQDMSEVCLKCDFCNSFIHFGCSNMPSYFAVRYLTSRVTYTCEKCVMDKTDNFDSIREVIEKNVTQVIDHKHSSEPNLSDVMSAVTELKTRVNELSTALPSCVNELCAAPLTNTAPMASYASAVKATLAPRYDVIVKPTSGGAVNNTAVTTALKKVPVMNLAKLRNGNVKLSLPDENAANLAISQIESCSSHSAAVMPMVKPKLTISSVDQNLSDDDVMTDIASKNHHLTELLHDENDMKILFSKKVGEFVKTVVVSVSPKIRDAIMTDGFLFIGLRRCKVYDRYWVTRCSHCLSYNHSTASCHNQADLKCGFCACNHKSSSCEQKHQLKCANCLAAGRSDVSHSAFSTACPIFIGVRHRLIQRTAVSKNSALIHASTTSQHAVNHPVD